MGHQHGTIHCVTKPDIDCSVEDSPSATSFPVVHSWTERKSAFFAKLSFIIRRPTVDMSTVDNIARSEVANY
ncbi:hypothetical protein BLOT_011761 [Blomia tropicalis]|nr:hypothetical protein BLOT_011761 [Blomia tropicalis]